MGRLELSLLFVGVTAATAVGQPAAPQIPRVVAVDGVGVAHACSSAIRAVAKSDGIPLELEVFSWSHGCLRLRLDQTDVPHIRERGAALADRICELRRNEPARPLVLLCYSAGCAVGLAAADHLPPNSLQRLILLEPSVSSRYDLRPALRAAAGGVDVFCSPRDIWGLGVAMRLVGTADDFHGSDAAGRYGFRSIIEQPADLTLYSALRQHFWTPADRYTGHHGRHNGVYASTYLRERVFPLFAVNP
jgi:pimeloyl-ACP methyl ester carboxylesterase